MSGPIPNEAVEAYKAAYEAHSMANLKLSSSADPFAMVNDCTAAGLAAALPHLNGWRDDIDNVPNNVFDVMAKKWDAALDTFTSHRFAGCVQVDGQILWSSPFHVDPVKLTDMGYRPTHWAPLPSPPLHPGDGKPLSDPPVESGNIPASEAGISKPDV